MQGRPLKPPEQRVNRHVPVRGEWQDIPLRNPARPPRMPPAPRGGWSAMTKAAWRLWWEDPASLMWGPAERDLVTALAYLHHDLSQGKVSVAAEIRLRMDGLGLSLKGKRDFRWRVSADEVGEKSKAKRAASPYQHLKAVPDAAVEGPGV